MIVLAIVAGPGRPSVFVAVRPPYLRCNFSRRFWENGLSLFRGKERRRSTTMMNSTRVVVKLRINLAGEHEMQSMERGLSLYGDANFGPGSRALHIRLADLISVAGTPNDERIRRFQVALLSYIGQKVRHSFAISHIDLNLVWKTVNY